MKPQRTDQPSEVSTEDAPRPEDEHVVTSDTTAEPGADDQNAVPAASGEVKTDDTTPNSSDPAPDDKENQKTPRRDRKSERRIARMSKKLSASEQREAANNIRIAELQEEVDSLKTATPKPPEPQLNDFASPREYAQAYAKWEGKANESAPKPRKDVPTRQTNTSTAPESGPILDDEVIEFQERGKEKLGDEFVQALSDGAAVSQVMGEYMLDSDVGPELYVYLADDQTLAKKIYDSSAPRAIKLLDGLAEQQKAGELGVGEGQLDIEEIPDASGDATPARDTPPKKPARRAGSRTTAAPKPPSDTKPGSSPNVSVNPESENMDDYAERRRKEEARKRGIPV